MTKKCLIIIAGFTLSFSIGAVFFPLPLYAEETPSIRESSQLAAISSILPYIRGILSRFEELLFGIKIAAFPTAEATTAFSARLSVSSDDAEQNVSSGAMDLSSSDLELIRDGSTDQIVGMRFTNVAVPKGATITNAYLEFTVDETANLDPINLKIQAQAADNPTTFTTATSNISSRSRTNTSVPWIPPQWTTVGAKQQTPNLSSVVQEVINRSSWASGNSMVFIITGTGRRVAESYNGGSSLAPLLRVEYTTSAATDTTPPAVSITAPANNATISGTSVAVSASATDNTGGSGVVGVQFYISGPSLSLTKFGLEDTTSPYGIIWDTTTGADGSYTLLAVARDAAGKRATSTSIGVTVQNAISPSPPPPSSVSPSHLSTTEGTAQNASTVSALSVPASLNTLYLAAFTSRNHATVNNITGLGLAWTRLRDQCSGRNNTGIEVWRAYGSPTTSGTVTATLNTSVTAAVIAVSRYSGADPTTPTGAVVGDNTLGDNNASCTGAGIDASSYSVPITTTANSVIYAAIADRAASHTPGSGYTERAEFSAGSSGSVAGIQVMDRATPSGSSYPVNGTFSSSVDYAVVGVEVRGSGDIVLELALPRYFSDTLRYPRRFPAGEKLRLSSKTSLTSVTGAALVNNVTGSSYALNFMPDTTHADAFVADVPNIPTADYTLSFLDNGVTRRTALSVGGVSTAPLAAPGQAKQSYVPSPLIKYRGSVCTYGEHGDACFWESAFAGNPDKFSQLLYTNNDEVLFRSINGGRSWLAENLDDGKYFPDIFLCCDAKVVYADDGQFFLSFLGGEILDVDSISPEEGHLSRWGMKGPPVDSRFYKKAGSAPPGVAIDYPKLAYDKSRQMVYISGLAVWIESLQRSENALFVSRDDGISFTEYPLPRKFRSLSSLSVGRDGTLYGATKDNGGRTSRFVRFDDADPTKLSIIDIANRSNEEYWPPRSSVSNHLPWYTYLGPEIVADNSAQSPHLGRVYMLWAEQERPEPSIDPEYPYDYYGFNFDIFISYSDNEGDTWSQPVLVNDDNGTGDQVFPSLAVDPNGIVHAAFIDRRNAPEDARFDVYYATSSDGVHFSSNLRLTDALVSMRSGRSIGDYNNMLVAYRDRAYVAFPCGDREITPSLRVPEGACFVQIGPEKPDIGDVDGNWSITMADSELAFNYYLGKVTLNTSQRERADANRDGNVTPADSQCIALYASGEFSCLD